MAPSMAAFTRAARFLLYFSGSTELCVTVSCHYGVSNVWNILDCSFHSLRALFWIISLTNLLVWWWALSTCAPTFAPSERPHRRSTQLHVSWSTTSVYNGGHQTTWKKCVYRSHPFLLSPLSAQRPVETSLSLAPDFAWAVVHSLSPVLRRATLYRLTFEPHQHCLLLKIGLRLICFQSRIMYSRLNQLNSSGVCCMAPL